MFLNILVAIDDSAHAARALDEALDLARTQRSRLTLICVASRGSWRYLAGPYVGMMPTQEDADEAAERTIAAARARVPDEIPVTTVVGRGSPAEAILARAEEGNHDLIVMGSRGRGAGRFGAARKREPPRPPSRPRSRPDRARRCRRHEARVGSAAVAAPAHDVITMGRIGADIYPQSDGPLEGVTAFSRSLGGTATNVAVAAARLGRRTAVITKVGDDPFGRYAVAALRRVRRRHAASSARTRRSADAGRLRRARPARGAADLVLPLSEGPRHDARVRPTSTRTRSGPRPSSGSTGTGLSDEPSLSDDDGRRSRCAIPGATTILDLDWRPMLWPDPAPRTRALPGRAPACLRRSSETAPRWRSPSASSSPRRARPALLALGPRLAVVKLGGEGVLVATEAGSEVVPPIRVEVVNGLGAGDAFGGALCHRLLAGDDPAAAVRFANAAGAHVVARLACADAMPTEAEVLELLEAAGAR